MLKEQQAVYLYVCLGLCVQMYVHITLSSGMNDTLLQCCIGSHTCQHVQGQVDTFRH